MPEISRFYGIVIKMYYNDHQPPHFHAVYGNDEMVVGINSLHIIAGRLPRRAGAMVLEWAAQHQTELQDDWDLARNMNPLVRIDPLT